MDSGSKSAATTAAPGTAGVSPVKEKVFELLEGRPVAHRRNRERAERRRAERVVERVDVAARLVAERGCIATSILMRELGINRSEAYYALRLLQLQGRVVKVVVAEKVAIWCRDRASAEELLKRLKETVHRLAIANSIRYATPKKILQAALRDRDAYELLSAFIPLSNVVKFHPVALGFVGNILRQLYESLRLSNNRYVYIVA